MRDVDVCTMKKLLFVFPSFEIGGTTVSTLNLISLLDKERYEATVMPLQDKGLLKEQFKCIPQLCPSLFIQSLHANSWREMPGLGKKAFAMVIRFLARQSAIKKAFIKIGWSNSLKGKEVDTIIACQENVATSFVAEAPVEDKLAWVRCDYARIANRQSNDRELYHRFRSIVCVSEGTFSSFIKIFPEYVSKTVCIPNPQNAAYIKSQGEMKENEPLFLTDRITLVSVGRLDPVKRFDQIALIASRLRERGLQFRWFIIGDGVERNTIRESIKTHLVEDVVVMLGAKTNPHYYIKHADLYVCLSVSEACPRVVNEAKILGTPTVSTNFPTIFEFVENGQTGIIAPLSGVPDAIMEYYTDEGLRKRIKDNIGRFEFDNTDLMRKIETIFQSPKNNLPKH